MEYLNRGKTYSISYQELKAEHRSMVEMSDKEFLNNLPRAIHLAAILCFFKEIPTYLCLDDGGIVHQLCHLLHIGTEDPLISLEDIRLQFAEDLKLA